MFIKGTRFMPQAQKILSEEVSSFLYLGKVGNFRRPRKITIPRNARDSVVS